MRNSFCLSLIRLVLPAMLVSLVLMAAGVARADTISTFNVSGTAAPEFGTGLTDTTFSGTLTIDINTGTITGIDIALPGLAPFDTPPSFSEQLSSSDWQLITGTIPSHGLALAFTTTPRAGSLIGFDGGTIITGIQLLSLHRTLIFAGSYVTTEDLFAYCITGGTISPSVASVTSVAPEPSSLALMGAALLCLLGFEIVRRRRSACSDSRPTRLTA